MQAILFATDKECHAALPGLEAPAHGHWVQTTMGMTTILVAVTGVGPINAALCLGRMQGTHSLNGVLNLGVAGGFDIKTHPLGTLVVSSEEIWPEYGLRTAQGIDPKGIGFPLVQTTQRSIHDSIPLAPAKAAQDMNLDLPDWPCGPSLTVSAATGTAEYARMLQRRYQPAMENMEGFALALGCFQTDIPFLEIRAISNLVGSRDKEHWDLQGAFSQLAPAISKLFKA